ncbi:MAG: T9SS type A sorting domain-containing protein [Bacteroidales bacterium]|nr:T9SS type A sorting domain-containing protein [Bacteroidales bacterium]
MKRISILLATLIAGFSMSLNAQNVSVSEAVDFTATDCHGNEIHLFDILDKGQAVLLDFFYYTCGPCQQIAGTMAEAYRAMGCNQHDVYFLEVSYIDSDQVCQQWIDQYGIEYPTIGAQGGGNNIFSLYGITGCPTLALIMPDHSIPVTGISQLYPFSVEDVILGLDYYGGLQPYDCTTTVPEEEGPSLDVYPNPTTGLVTISGNENLTSISVCNVLGQVVYEAKLNDDECTLDMAQFDAGVYMVRISTENGVVVKRVTVMQ